MVGIPTNNWMFIAAIPSDIYQFGHGERVPRMVPAQHVRQGTHKRSMSEAVPMLAMIGCCVTGKGSLTCA